MLTILTGSDVAREEFDFETLTDSTWSLHLIILSVGFW